MKHANIPADYALVAATPAHIPLLNAIELAAAAIFPPGSLPEHILADRMPQSTLAQAMRDGTLWVVLDAGARPVGYGLLQFVDGLALLAQLDVHPDHGRKGLGTALVRRIAKAARERGAKFLYLTTFTHVAWNGPFYAKLGFAEIPEAEQPCAIRDILAEEKARGLENRAAMRLRLASPS